MRILIIIFLLFSIPILRAQKNNIINCKIPKQGLYLSYEEFQNNAPSISDNYEIIETTRGKHRYILKILDENGETIRLEKPIWGVCTEDSIFINLISDFEHTLYLCKLEFIGYYSHFRVWDGQQHRYRDYVLYYPNGEYYYLSKKNLKRVLKSDPWLYNGWRNEKNSNSKRVEYIKHFNERHPVK